MEIKSFKSLFFEGLDNGIVLDNAYDQYKRNRYIDYINENHINCLEFQDVDMSLLMYFSNIDFLIVPNDAENVEVLNKYNRLIGLEIDADLLEKLDLSLFKQLKYLVVYNFSNQKLDFTLLTNLKSLILRMSDIKNLENLKELSNIESLYLDFCKKIVSLKGIEKLFGLKKLVLDYCTKLEDVNDVSNLGVSLKYLKISDCNNIRSLEFLKDLFKLETLYLTSFETKFINILDSVSFVEKMLKLKNFMTDYRIKDGDLKPLLKIEKVELLRFYRYYNLNEKFFR